MKFCAALLKVFNNQADNPADPVSAKMGLIAIKNFFGGAKPDQFPDTCLLTGSLSAW